MPGFAKGNATYIDWGRHLEYNGTCLNVRNIHLGLWCHNTTSHFFIYQLWPLMLTCHMSTSPCSTVLGTGINNKANWNQADEVALINYLIKHKSEAGSRASFNQEQFQVVSRILREHTIHGGPKTPTTCRSKWTQVSLDPCHISS